MTVPPVPPVPPKKGLSTLAKVLIGCGLGLLLLMGGCMVAVWMGASWVGGKVKNLAEDIEKNPDAATVKIVEAMMRLNPEVDVVSSDPAAGTITLKEKKTGKVITFNAVDIQNGKITFEEDGKETSVDFSASGEQGGTVAIESGDQKIVYGAGDQASVPSWVPTYPGGRQEGFNSVESNQERNGTYTLHTADSVETVVAYFEEQLKAAGFTVEKSTLDISGAITANLNAKAEGRGVNIVVSSQEGETQGLVAYNEKR